MNDSKKSKAQQLTLYWTQAQPTVTAYINSIVTNFQDAEDILQSVALTVADKYDNYNSESSFVAWSMGIAKNKILHYFREHEKDKRIRIVDAKVISQIAEVYQEDRGKLNEIKKALDFCMSKLKGRWKQIIEMRYLLEFTTPRIAQHFGITENAVFVTLHRVRLALQKCIDNQLAKQR